MDASRVAAELYGGALGVEPDAGAPSDIARLCFLSLDPDIRLHGDGDCWQLNYR